MNTLIQLLTDTLRIIFDIIPRLYKIQANENWIMFALWDKVKKLNPGVYWYIPLFHTMQKENISYRNLSLNRQTLLTKDRKEVFVSATVFYQIIDIKKVLVDNSDIWEILQSEILWAIKNYILKNNLDTIISQTEWIENTSICIVRELENKIWIQVDKINITDIATCVHLNNIDNKAYARKL